jgi:hypothetical protein
MHAYRDAAGDSSTAAHDASAVTAGDDGTAEPPSKRARSSSVAGGDDGAAHAKGQMASYMHASALALSGVISCHPSCHRPPVQGFRVSRVGDISKTQTLLFI